MTAYYNEFDPFVADWLRELIKAGHIAAGDVDERSIKEVKPDDLKGYTQCHFFAGIGGWSRALRLAGWPDDRPVWTGSCPCQPFSAAGNKKGTDDERHLWPAWFELIKECRPSIIFGEQVEDAIKHGWLDLVQSQLEGESYAVGSAGLSACGVGSPHIRKRLYFTAQDGVAFPHGDEHKRAVSGVTGEASGETGGHGSDITISGEPRGAGANVRRGLADADSAGLQGHGGLVEKHGPEGREDTKRHGAESGVHSRSVRPTSATNGFWGNADWIRCKDEKWRPVEHGTFPLVDGVSGRVGKLRGYGNAIVPQVAAEFIKASQ